MKKLNVFLKLLPAILFLIIALMGCTYNQITSFQSQSYAQEEMATDNITINESEKFSTVFSFSYKEKQKFKADQAIINIQIETLDMDQKIAYQKNKEIYDKIISELDNQGAENVKITYNYCSPCSNSCSIRSDGYRVYTNLSYQLNNLENIVSSIENVENLSANVLSIEYKLSDYQEKYDNLLTLAVENAKAKAKKLLNKEDISILKIKEEKLYCCNSKYQVYCKGIGDFLHDTEIEMEAEVQIVVRWFILE